MSTNLAYALPAERTRETLIPHLRPRRVQIVTTRAQRGARPKLVYALGATAVIFAIFLAQLLLTIALSSGAYKITGLQASEQSLGRVSSALNEKLDTLGSSQNLEANALALGMVNSSQAAFLRLSDGAVLGSAVPAAAAPAPAVPPTGSTATTASTDSVPNFLLSAVPLVQSTGSGHGDANAVVSTAGTTQSTQGSAATASTGATVPASSASSNSGELPSPVTH
jgi:hypothetical protein